MTPGGEPAETMVDHLQPLLAVPGCVFCSIVAGQTAAAHVAQTADAIAFLDRSPVFKGHVLIVPRCHVVTLADLPTDLLAPVFGLAQAVSVAVTRGLGAQGSFVALNNVVSQSVAHLHVHVVPRTKGDGLRGFFWPRVRYAEGEADQYAARLRAAMVEPC